MKMPIALSAVVSLNQGLHIDAYKIHTPVGHNYRQLSRCHKCLQRFALYANLTYVLTEPNARGRKTHDDRLKMVAEIDNHIPFWSVQDSCLSTICATHTIILKDERKRFHKTNPSSSLDLHSGAHLVVDEEKRNDKVNDESNEVSISGTDLIGRGSNDRRDSVTEEFRSPDNWRKKRNDNEWKVAHKKFRLFGATFDVMSYDASNIAKNMSANPDGKNSFHQGYDSTKQASTAKNVLVSTNNRNDALETLQIIGATVHKQNDIPTFTSYCLLLQKNLPELFIQACLRCLDFSDIDVRYSITVSTPKIFQWALQYATDKIPSMIMLKCGNTCGSIKWGSQNDCLLISLHQEIKDSSSVDLQLWTGYPYQRNNVISEVQANEWTGFHYSNMSVKHLKVTAQNCRTCIQHTVEPLIGCIDANEEIFSCMTKQHTHANIIDFRNKCSSTEGPCEKTTSERQVSERLFTVPLVSLPSSGQPEGDITENTWTTRYQCMYFMPIIRKKPERDDYSTGKSKIRSACLSCLLGILGGSVKVDEALMKIVKKVQPTSHKSNLIFYNTHVDVQESAIKCWDFCTWVSGLSDPMCKFLESMIAKERTPVREVQEIRSERSENANERTRMPGSSHGLTAEIPEGHFSTSSHSFVYPW